MDRTINVTVTGEFVRKDSKNAGVQGEANVTGLHIVMSDDWEAFSKRIIWRNALGESPVAVLLYNSVEDLVAKKDPLTFDTAIPAEPLALEGWCSFTIEGFRESDPTAVAITVTDHLLVKPNDAYTTPKEPTPTQAQQLQTQIDGIVPQVSTLVGNAIEALEQAEEAVKVWEAYDSAKTYLPLQKVSRLGSSYICKAACKGVAPELDVAGGVEGAHWLLIASKGDQGEQGAEGPQGKTGKQGIQGERGLTGERGVQGIQGIQGPQGVQGAAGPVGPTGPEGPQGETGAKGATGATGAQGPAGADGSTPNIQVGTTTTLAAGSAATVKRRAGSPDAAPIFDFGIPKGADAVNPGDMTKAVYDPKGKAQDIFAYADQKMPKTGGAFTGGVSGVSPTSGSAKGFRNIYFGNGAPASSLGANGDVYINIG